MMAVYISAGVAFISIILVCVFLNRLKSSREKTAEYERKILSTVLNNKALSPQTVLPGKASAVRALENFSAGVRDLSIELAQKKTSLSEVMYAIHDGVVIVDRAANVVAVNRVVEELFGISEKRARELSLIACVRDHEISSAVSRCLESGESQSKTVYIERTKQTFTVTATRAESGALLVIQDITRLRQLEKVRKEFISNISHELRTPIASLKAIVETLRDGAIDDRAITHKFLSRSEIEIDKLAELVNELGELSTIESQGIQMHFELAYPATICREVSERMTAQAEKKGVALLLHLSPSVPAVRCDKKRLEQVLVNLVHNAIKFTPEGGRILITLTDENQSAVISVTDSGAGIPADDLPHVFERFFKVDKARSSEGTGLGLAIAKHLVFAHGGMIWAESTEGQGAKFSFSIPATATTKEIEKYGVEVTN